MLWLDEGLLGGIGSTVQSLNKGLLCVFVNLEHTLPRLARLKDTLGANLPDALLQMADQLFGRRGFEDSLPIDRNIDWTRMGKESLPKMLVLTPVNCDRM